MKTKTLIEQLTRVIVFQVISSANDYHTHSVEILFADITSPPSGGITYTSSSTLNHTHTINLSMQQLTGINSGSTVTVTSSADGSHSHNWVITKP